MFIQNTKSFFLVYIPIIIIIFFIANRIGCILKRFRKCCALTIYSFWLFLAVIIVQRNAYTVFFLFLIHIQNSFSLNYQIYLINWLTFLVFGLFFIVFVVILPASKYLYNKDCEIFLGNIHPKRGAFILSFTIYTIRPIVESATHALLYNFPKAQLLVLSLVSAFMVICYIVF